MRPAPNGENFHLISLVSSPLHQEAADRIDAQAAELARLIAAVERYMDLYYHANTDAINEYSGNVRADTDAMCQSIAKDAQAFGVNPSCLRRDAP